MRPAWLLLGIGLTGCGAELTVLPESIEWGEIDFNVPTPDPGHDAREVTLTNIGSGTLEVVITELDDDRLTVGGQFVETDPPRLVLEPEQWSILTLGVSGYTPGETGTTVRGEVVFAAGRLRDDIVVPWSYVPVRDEPDN